MRQRRSDGCATWACDIRLLSGDRADAVAPIAAALGIDDWQAGCSPVHKVAAIEALVAAGRNVLMVGDGLNDSPSLAAATVSASPATRGRCQPDRGRRGVPGRLLGAGGDGDPDGAAGAQR